MSVLCLYLCVCMSVANIAPISKPHLQNSHNFLQCPSSTKFKDGRACWSHLWRSTCGYAHTANYTSVDCNALTALLRLGLLWTLFLQLCNSWQHFDWYSVSCSLSAVEELVGYSWYRGNLQTPGPLVLWLSSKSIVLRHLSISRRAFSAVSSRFLKTFFLGKVNGYRVILLFLILYNTLFSETELLAKDRMMIYCPTWLAVERAIGIITNNSWKFEDLVLMIAKRQTYRHRDRDIIQTCYSIVFWQRRC